MKPQKNIDFYKMSSSSNSKIHKLSPPYTGSSNYFIDHQETSLPLSALLEKGFNKVPEHDSSGSPYN